MAEVSVKIEQDDMTLTEKYLEYGTFALSHDDPILGKMVADTLAKFRGDLIDPEITIKVKFSW